MPSLVASADPVLGTSITVDLGNSRGVTTLAFLFLGLSRASIPTTLGGTLLVGNVVFTLPLTIDGAGASLPADLPVDLALCGLVLDLQAIELDGGALRGAAFTAGLELLLGG